MLASKVYPLTTPLLTLRKDSELGKQQLGRRHPVMDIFHIQHQGKELVSFLSRRAATATRRQKLEQEMHKAKLQGRGHTLSTQMVLARRAELQAVQLATDVKSLIQWLNHDILALAGPPGRAAKTL